MKKEQSIIIEGACQNNLKNVNVNIPKNAIVVITGVSGSGKSTLAFDTLYAEGLRRYVENLSSQARFFLNAVKKPKVKRIENLSPAIAIDQRNGSQNPRSTVGTMTDIYDFFRVLFAEGGTPFCPECGQQMKKQTEESLITEIKKLSKGAQIAVVSALYAPEKNNQEKLAMIEQQRYARVRVDRQIMTLMEAKTNLTKDSKLEIVVDRIMLDGRLFDRERFVDSLQTAAKISQGEATVIIDNEKELSFSKYYVCGCTRSLIKKISPKNFSFNLPEGACETCTGLGYVSKVSLEQVIPNKKLSINEGAIMPWSRTGGRLSNGDSQFDIILKSLARQYRFSLNSPLETIAKNKLKKIYYGTGQETVEIIDKEGNKKQIIFQGLIKYIQDKYEQAESVFIRGEYERYLHKSLCPLCQGKRLKKQFLNVRVFEKTIDEMMEMELSQLLEFLKEQQKNIRLKKVIWSNNQKVVFEKLLPEIITRLEPLCDVGLQYLSLSRGSQTISGGEFQRTRLASQLYSGLNGVIYVLDEPTIGLHSRDTKKLINIFRQLKERGNSVIIVEHDREIMKAADHIIDLGPGAGQEGGMIIFEGDLKKMKKVKTETSLYLNNKKKFVARGDKTVAKKFITIEGAKENNLKNIDVKLPLGKLIAMVGVSGGGKSSLVNEILAKELRRRIMGSFEEAGQHRNIKGIEHISKVVVVDQSPIGRTPRSNPATYTGVFTHIRKVFTETELAKKKGYTAGHFSFNMRGGRCEYCQGEGLRKIEMHLLDDVFAVCPHCNGTRYNNKMLQVQYHGVNIADVLNMSVEYAYCFFGSQSLIAEKLKALCDVGLGYLRLGQNATALSGGEAQRIKLATELSRKSNGNTFYILDEPTIGLHFSDVKRLLDVLQGLTNKGNTVLMVEHNMDVIGACDWVLELGPEGGAQGGYLVFEGTPEKLKGAKTWTGKFF